MRLLFSGFLLFVTSISTYCQVGILDIEKRRCYESCIFEYLKDTSKNEGIVLFSNAIDFRDIPLNLSIVKCLGKENIETINKNKDAINRVGIKYKIFDSIPNIRVVPLKKRKIVKILHANNGSIKEICIPHMRGIQKSIEISNIVFSADLNRAVFIIHYRYCLHPISTHLIVAQKLNDSWSICSKAILDLY